MKLLEKVAGYPLVWINNATGNYALSVLLYVVLIGVFMFPIIYYQVNNSVKLRTAAPFLFETKNKFLGKDSEKFEKCSMEIYNETKASQLGGSLISFLIYPLYVLFFFVIYHPITILYSSVANLIPELSQIAMNINPSGYNAEFRIISAVRQAPEAFAGYDISSIQNINSSLFGIDFINPAFGIAMVIPVIALGFMLIRALRPAVVAIRKKKNGEKVNKMSFAQLVIIIPLIVLFSFYIPHYPVMFFAYLFISSITSMISNKIANSIVSKRKQAWIKEKEEKCKAIVESYGIEKIRKVGEPDESDRIDIKKIMEADTSDNQPSDIASAKNNNE